MRSCEVAIIWPDIYIYIYVHIIYIKIVQAAIWFVKNSTHYQVDFRKTSTLESLTPHRLVDAARNGWPQECMKRFVVLKNQIRYRVYEFLCQNPDGYVSMIWFCMHHNHFLKTSLYSSAMVQDFIFGPLWLAGFLQWFDALPDQVKVILVGKFMTHTNCDSSIHLYKSG